MLPEPLVLLPKHWHPWHSTHPAQGTADTGQRCPGARLARLQQKVNCTDCDILASPENDPTAGSSSTMTMAVLPQGVTSTCTPSLVHAPTLL